jgi:hypothetical protein
MDGRVKPGHDDTMLMYIQLVPAGLDPGIQVRESVPAQAGSTARARRAAFRRPG